MPKYVLPGIFRQNRSGTRSLKLPKRVPRCPSDSGEDGYHFGKLSEISQFLPRNLHFQKGSLKDKHTQTHTHTDIELMEHTHTLTQVWSPDIRGLEFSLLGKMDGDRTKASKSYQCKRVRDEQVEMCDTSSHTVLDGSFEQHKSTRESVAMSYCI